MVFPIRRRDSRGVLARNLRRHQKWLGERQHGKETRVPTADDRIEADDTLQVIGRHGEEGTLRKLFATG